MLSKPVWKRKKINQSICKHKLFKIFTKVLGPLDLSSDHHLYGVSFGIFVLRLAYNSREIVKTFPFIFMLGAASAKSRLYSFLITI